MLSAARQALAVAHQNQLKGAAGSVCMKTNLSAPPGLTGFPYGRLTPWLHSCAASRLQTVVLFYQVVEILVLTHTLEAAPFERSVNQFFRHLRL
jgi:hypothetical protein